MGIWFGFSFFGFGVILLGEKTEMAMKRMVITASAIGWHLLVVLIGWADTGAYWREGYKLDNYDFRADIEKLYNQLKPFYKQVNIINQ